MAVDREYKVRVNIIKEGAGDAQAIEGLRQIKATGENTAEELKHGFEALNLTHHEEHQVLRLVGAQFGELGHIAHYVLNPITAAVAGITIGLQALIEEQKKLKEEMEATAETQAKVFEDNLKQTQAMAEEARKFHDEWDAWNAKIADPENNGITKALDAALAKTKAMEEEVENLFKELGFPGAGEVEKKYAKKEEAGEIMRAALEADRAADEQTDTFESAKDQAVKALAAKHELEKAYTGKDETGASYRDNFTKQLQAAILKQQQAQRDITSGQIERVGETPMEKEFRLRNLQGSRQRYDDASGQVKGVEEAIKMVDDQLAAAAATADKSAAALKAAEEKMDSLRKEAQELHGKAQASFEPIHQEEAGQYTRQFATLGYNPDALERIVRAVANLQQGKAQSSDTGVVEAFAKTARDHGIQGRDLANLENGMVAYFEEVKAQFEALWKTVGKHAQDLHNQGQNYNTRTTPGS